MRDALEKVEIRALFDECQIKLREVEDDLLDLADGKIETSPEFVNRVFRAFHSVNGAAGNLRYAPLKRLSHASEDLLGEVRDGKIELSHEHAEALLSATDRMREMVADGDQRLDLEFGLVLERLNTILNLQRNPPPVKSKPAGECAEQREQPLCARGLKMLIAEDDLTARVVLQCLLSRYGDCHTALNGREAVEAFRSARQAGEGYDLVCMDVRMPEMDGTEAVRQIRLIEESEGILSSAGVKIFMATGIRDIKTVTASFSALCDAYLYKPIDGEKLEDNLRSFGLIGQLRT
ncbi:MAG: response regulator [Bryobacteraceae bacterium]|jgi:two-component system chemotaxis response regulator CheY